MISLDRYTEMKKEMISDLQMHTNGLPYAFAFDLWTSKFNNPALVYSMMVHMTNDKTINCTFERVELNRG